LDFLALATELDAFASSVVNPTSAAFDRPQTGNNLHGLYGSITKLLPDAFTSEQNMLRYVRMHRIAGNWRDCATHAAAKARRKSPKN
jgi:hypothetical protein